MSSYATEQSAPSAPPAPPHVDAHEPTCSVPWPTVLVEGEEKSGKSTEAAKLTGCGRFSESFWLELGTEGTAEWYGLVPGAKYKVLEHDGKFATIKAKIAQVHAYAEWAVAQGLPPVCFVFDSAGALWKQIQAWVDWKATQSESAKRKLQQDPAAEISAPISIRNQGKALWDEIMLAIHRIPGVKVLLSRGQEVTRFENGQATKDKTWSVVGHKELGYEVSAWVRLRRSQKPEIIGLWSPVAGIQADAKDAKTEKVEQRDFSLEWLVFERYGLNPENATVRNLHDVNDVSAIEDTAAARAAAPADTTGLDEDRVLAAAQLLEAASAVTDKAAFAALWKEMNDNGLGLVRLAGGKLGDQMTALAKRIGEKAQPAAAPEGTAPAAEPPVEPAPEEPAPADDQPATPVSPSDGLSITQRQAIGKRMMALAVHSDRSQAIFAGDVINRPVRSIGALTAAEADKVLSELDNLTGLGQAGIDTVAAVIANARQAAA